MIAVDSRWRRGDVAFIAAIARGQQPFVKAGDCVSESAPGFIDVKRVSETNAGSSVKPEPALHDLLRDALDIVFVGINPSIYSAQRGHYFARASNRFWPCFSRSALSRDVREGLAVERLTAEHDRALLNWGIGFTDVVKRPTTRAGDLDRLELAAGVAALIAKMQQYRPRVACFHGVTGYRPVHRLFVGSDTQLRLGLQPLRIGATHIFVVPNPSGANAHVTRQEQTAWYDRLFAFLHA